MSDTTLSLETILKLQELVRIGRRAFAKAQEESRRLGVPNVYSINGRIYYELPNGELSLNDPWEGKLVPPGQAE